MVFTPVYRWCEGEETVFVRRIRKVPFTVAKVVIRFDVPVTTPSSSMNMRFGIMAHRVFRRSQSTSNRKTFAVAGAKLLPCPSIRVVHFRIGDLKHYAEGERMQSRVTNRDSFSHIGFAFIRVGKIFFESG